MKKPEKIITNEDFSNSKFVENKFINDATNMTCANCISVSSWKGKVEPEKCPNCGCDDENLVRVRYWTNGEPDYSVNLLKKK